MPLLTNQKKNYFFKYPQFLSRTLNYAPKLFLSQKDEAPVSLRRQQHLPSAKPSLVLPLEGEISLLCLFLPCVCDN